MTTLQTETRLNIGAGATVIDGWTPIDRKLGTEAFPLSQYADNSVDEIRASHILEHFSYADVPNVLKEWVRVLRPGGRIRVAVPDLDRCAVSDDPDRFHYIMGGQTDENDFHKSAFTAPVLAEFMADAGVADIRPWSSENTDTASHPISLNLEGIKPFVKKQMKVSALMSVPRVGWTDALSTINQAVAQFSMPVRTVYGVFWGQCMQRGMEDAVAAGTDWILCIDYDSMITAKHIQGLIDDLANTPDADAVCALQRRRRSDGPLCVVRNAVGGKIEVDGTPIHVTTGHFGLTLIKVDAIQRMPKPWFCEKPNADGEWGEGRVDQDIWFWHEWNKAGNNLYLSPSVSIGHLELMVSEFDEENNPRHVHIPDWRKKEGLM